MTKVFEACLERPQLACDCRDMLRRTRDQLKQAQLPYAKMSALATSWMDERAWEKTKKVRPKAQAAKDQAWAAHNRPRSVLPSTYCRKRRSVINTSGRVCQMASI